MKMTKKEICREIDFVIQNKKRNHKKLLDLVMQAIKHEKNFESDLVQMAYEILTLVKMRKSPVTIT